MPAAVSQLLRCGSTPSTEILRFGFRATRQTLGDPAGADAHHCAVGLSGQCQDKAPAEAGAVGSAAGVTQKSLFRGSSTFTASSGPAATSGSVAVSMGLDLPVTRSVMAAASAKGSAIGVIKSDPP